jgi:hypothetical protein
MDHRPLVRLFCPWSAAVWLLSELDPDNPDLAFGLCDFGHCSPKLGTVRLSDLESWCGPDGLRIERDLAFRATRTLAGYAAEARMRKRIVP